MSEECTHNCSTCTANCASREEVDFRAHLAPDAKVKHVYAVMSGKGGVGKSLVTGLLASKFMQKGYRAAILDADITGPSIPKAFGVDSERIAATADGQYMFPCTSKNGIQIISANNLLENPTDPIIWRGSLIAQAVKQFYEETIWDDVDYMFVDMPPGTGDVPLTVFQSLPIEGIIIVTSPQELVGMIVEKAVNMANKMELPILGIVENMSYLTCPDCGRKINVFGESRVDDIAGQYGLRVLAKLPIDPQFAELTDQGRLEEVDFEAMDSAFNIITK